MRSALPGPLRRLLPSRLQVDRNLFSRYAKLRLPPDAVYVEIGAATGRSSVAWMSFLGLSPERCHLVEACPVNFQLLQQRIPEARTYHYALSDHVGTIPLYIIDKPTDEGSSRSNTIDAQVLKSKSKLPVRSVTVPTITMSRMFEIAGIPRCHFLYMNCEGSEYDILGDDVSFLDRVSLFELELHQGLFSGARHVDQMIEKRIAIYDLLEGRGFFNIGGHSRRHLSTTAQHITCFWEKAPDIPEHGLVKPPAQLSQSLR